MISQEKMIERQLLGRDINDPRVLKAMASVDRKLFIPQELWDQAYEDGPLPIGRGQTISQPYIVAYMSQALKLREGDKVLEIGTGCGYHAAVMSHLAREVYSMEIIQWLCLTGRNNLKKAGIENVITRCADGYEGWEEHAPYDAIVLTAAPNQIPRPLKAQLKVGGRLLAPVGSGRQKLLRLTKTAENDFSEETLLMVSFVPMTGRAENQ